MQRILLTGAGGNLGKMLREKCAEIAPILRLSDISEMDVAQAGEEVVTCDLADADAVFDMVEGCDMILHFGGISSENTFASILEGNIKGVYNLYEAARKHGVTRIVFASSNHVIGFHERETRLDATADMRPDSMYGVSKGFGELMGQYYFDKFGIETVCLRIGSSFEKPRNRRMLATWLSFDDLAGLVQCCVKADRTGFAVVYGASDNSQSWWDNRMVAHLGWHPKDSADAFADDPDLVGEANDPNDPAIRFQGGGFAGAGHFED